MGVKQSLNLAVSNFIIYIISRLAAVRNHAETLDMNESGQIRLSIAAFARLFG
jgi:hypothetical protein